MSVDQLGDLLLRWEELHEQGVAVEPEELCRDCPELLPELRRHIQALRAMTRALNDHAQSTVEALDSARPPAEGAKSSAVLVPGFEIVHELGRGGMGVVYKARQISLNRFVALKMILSGAHAGTTQRERFRREGEAAAHLIHPNIVQVYEVGEHERQPYCALELVEGRALNEVIRAGTPAFDWSAEVVEQLARAVDYAHRRGIVHRDLKPGNVLLQKADSRQNTARSGNATPAVDEYVPKITDFGLAKRLGDSQVQTKTGDVLGTPSYMAPEQAAGKSKEIGPAADIYALGAILYELLCGAPPFEGISTWDTVAQVLNREPVRPSRRNPQAPRDLETICLKCLQKEPAKRYGTGLALAEDLHRYLQGEPIEARPVGRLERGVMWARRRPAVSTLLATSAALLLALLVGGWIAALRQAKSNRDLAKVNSANHEALVRLNVTQGLHFVDDDDLFGSLVWFARALVRERDPAREATHRTRLASVLRQCPRLVQLWFHDGSVTHIEFSPDGQWVLTASDDSTARVWNAISGVPRFEPLRHGLAVFHARFSSDGRRIVTASADKTAQLWDAISGQKIATLTGHAKAVNDAAFSRDGARVITAGADDTARIWNASDGKPIGAPLGHPGPVSRACFHPDGMRVLTACEDGAARIWRIEPGTAKVEARFTHSGPVHDAVFSPGGSQVATASDDGTARLWDSTTGNPVSGPLQHHGPVLRVVFRPDGQRLATASADLTARIWDCKSGTAQPSVMRHYSSVTSVAFSSDGARLATASDDNTCRVWDANTGKPVTPPLPNNGEISDVCFSPDGLRLATASEDTTARIYELESREKAIPTLEHGGGVVQVSFDSAGTRVLTACADGTARIWDAATGKRLAELRGHKSALTSASFSANDQYLVTASADATARVWDARTYRQVQVLAGHRDPVRGAAFSLDASKILTTGEDGTARVWDRASGRVLCILKPDDNADPVRINDAVFSPDGARIATAGADRSVRLWAVASGKQTAECQVHQRQVVQVAFSPDGSRLATASLDRTARILDVGTDRLIQTALLQHAGPVRQVSFRADGTRLITCSDDNTARVWDAATGEPLLPPMRHYGSIVKARFSLDGKRLATASADNTGRVWDAETGEPITGPLTHRNWGVITDIAFNSAGDSVATASADGTAEIWPLSSIGTPPGDLEQFAQLLSGVRVEPDTESLAPLEVGTLRELWQRLRSHHPELVGSATVLKSNN